MAQYHIKPSTHERLVQTVKFHWPLMFSRDDYKENKVLCCSDVTEIQVNS